MSELHVLLLQLAVLIAVVGAATVGRLRDAESIRHWSVFFSMASLASAVGAWLTVLNLGLDVSLSPDHRWDLIYRLAGQHVFALDTLSGPLFPLAALLYALTALTTLHTKMRRFSFSGMLASEAIVLATLGCVNSWGIVLLLSAATIPPYFELVVRRRPTRVYAIHMGVFVGALIVGQGILYWNDPATFLGLCGVALLLLAVLIRSGVAPFHCWITDLFEHASFGTALLTVAPMMGAYAAVRLLLPVAAPWILQGMGVLAVATAVYAAGMALVQREARRFFCFIFLSHSALVLVGLDTVSVIGLTGALCVWLAVELSMAGLGFSLRALEARHGRLSLVTYHGIYEHTPLLAICFFLTGLASVGFPGTVGFLGTEMLVDGAVQASPMVGVAVVLAGALNGIALVQVYFKLFTGAKHVAAVPLQIGWRERVAVLTLSVLIFSGGLFPQPTIRSRHHAAEELLSRREVARHLAPVRIARGLRHNDRPAAISDAVTPQTQRIVRD